MNSRLLYKAVHGRMPARKTPRRRSALHQGGTARSWQYKGWVRSLPCAVCGATDRVEQVATEQRDALLEAMFGDIARRDRKRVRRNIDCIDCGVRKPHGGEHRQTARARAQIEHALDRERIADERGVLAFKQFAVQNFAEI